MKFIKVIIDGKEYYQRVDDDLKVEDKIPDEEPEIIDAEIGKADEPTGSEKFKKDAQEFFERVGNGAKDLGVKIVDGAKSLGEKISVGAKDLGAKIKEGTERLFNRDKSLDPTSSEAKLLKLLPYMTKEDAHGVALKLVEKPETLGHINIGAIMQFLTGEDCDMIFVKAIESGAENIDLESATPFVSKEALSGIVDGYIEGKYEALDIDKLYPFLSDNDIKRIFYFIIGENNKDT